MTDYRNRRNRRARGGFTLVELLIVLVMTALLSAALGAAFNAEFTTQHLIESRRADRDTGASMERTISRLIEGACLTSTATDTTTFFQGISENGSSDLGCDRLTITTTGLGIPMASMNSADDFETQQASRGPVGGPAEVSLSTTAVGSSGTHTGLFERIQRPSDGDPTQGGNETVLSADVTSIGFQFWDGTQWVSAWDTTTGTRRMPQAVQVSYILKSAQDQTPKVFVVTVPASDVTAQNPYTATGT